MSIVNFFYRTKYQLLFLINFWIFLFFCLSFGTSPFGTLRGFLRAAERKRNIYGRFAEKKKKESLVGVVLLRIFKRGTKTFAGDPFLTKPFINANASD